LLSFSAANASLVFFKAKSNPLILLPWGVIFQATDSPLKAGLMLQNRSKIISSHLPKCLRVLVKLSKVLMVQVMLVPELITKVSD
jgi:hypothetical protein